MERRLVALQVTVRHTLLMLEDSAALWLAAEAEAQQTRRSECRTRRSPGESPCRECCEQRLVIAWRWSPLTGRRRTDRDALQVGTAAREERMHPQPRQRDRREWRDDPTRTNTSGRSHHVTVEAVRDAAHGVPVEGHRHSPPIRSRTGARSQTRTGTHSHSRTWRLLPSWLLCPSCLHTQPLLRRHSQG